MSRERVEQIRQRLREALATEEVTVTDESHLHVGHAGAASGLGHFAVTVRCAAFNGQNMLARHRQVYAALGSLMQTDIHALSIRALAPDE